MVVEAPSSAAGAPSETWGVGVAQLLAAAAPLEDWRLEVSDRDAALTGTAPDAATRDAVVRGFTDAAAAGGFTPQARIAAGPRALSAAAVT